MASIHDGDILSVAKIGEDKYLVRTAAGGGFRQQYMTADEVRAAGGIVPTGDTYYVQLYASPDLYGGADKTLSPAYKLLAYLVSRQGMSEQAARRIVELALQEPTSSELRTLTPDLKEWVANEMHPDGKYYVLQGEGVTPQIVSQKDAIKLLHMDPGTEEYHDTLISLGLIPEGTPYVDPVLYKKAMDALEPYINPDTGALDLVAALKDERIDRAYLDILLGAGTVEKFERNKVRLADGNYITIDAWNKLDEKYKTLGLEHGLGAIENQMTTDWLENQVATGQAGSIKEARQQLNEIESGKYLVYDYESGEYVPTYKKAVEQVEGMVAQLPKFLQDAWAKGPDAYKAAVADYNSVMHTMQELTESSGAAIVGKDLLDKYRQMLQPAGMSDEDYAKVAPFIKIGGFDSAAAYKAGAPTDAINTLMMSILSPETKSKIDSGEMTLLPYGEVVETSYLNSLPAADKEKALSSGLTELSEKEAKQEEEDKSVFEKMAEFPEKAIPFLEEGAHDVVALGASPTSKAVLSIPVGMALSLAEIPVTMIGLIGQAGDDPRSIPSLIKGTAEGMVNHVVGTLNNVVTGEYRDDVATGDLVDLVNDITTAYWIVEGGARAGKGAVNSVASYVHPKGLPFSAIAKEISTGRIKTPDALATNYANAMNTALKQATIKGGKFTFDVPIEGTNMSLRVLKTPVSQVVGDVVFHGTHTVLNKSGAVVKGSLLNIAEKGGGKVTVGPEGLYTSPWAAMSFSRGGVDRGIALIVTDATQLKSGAPGLSRGLTQSDRFIRKADEGFYGSSKTWRGDLETEIVGAPGTKLYAPPPKADLVTRVIAGRYSDFFTHDGAEFLPVKLMLDVKRVSPSAVEALKSPANLYSVKLWTLASALRDTAEALKHPDLMLKDVAGITKELFNIQNYLRSSNIKGGQITFPGVRDMYLITHWGKSISEIAKNLYDRAFRMTKQQFKTDVRPDSKIFRDALERNMKRIYKETATAIINQFKGVAQAYVASTAARDKFESAYIANLGVSTEALAKSSDHAGKVARSITDSLSGSLPDDQLERLYSNLLVSSNMAGGSGVSSLSEPAVVSSIMSSITPDRPVTTPVSVPSSTTRTTPSTVSPTTRTPRTTETPVTITEIRPPDRLPGERPPSERPPDRPPRERLPDERPPDGPPDERREDDRPPDRPPDERPPDGPPDERPPDEPPSGLSRTQPEADITGNMAQLPDGSIAWKQGIFWKWIPREDIMSGAAKPRTLPKGVTPIGARFTEQRTPAKTIQMIGAPGSSVPDVAVDLGVADIFISNQAKEIRYMGKGERTNVGISMDSPTKGMTVTASMAVPKGHAYATDYYPEHSVSRPHIVKTGTEPVRAGSTRAAQGKDRVDITERTKQMLSGDYEDSEDTETAESVSDKPKRKAVSELDDDISDLVTLSDEDIDELSGISEDDIWGEDTTREKRVAKNRVRVRKTQPLRGRDNPTTMLRGMK